MQITSNGVLLNGIAAVSPSSVFSGSVAIQDIDGTFIHVPKTEMTKLINLYNTLSTAGDNEQKYFMPTIEV
jgi:hypothetical protein